MSAGAGTLARGRRATEGRPAGTLGAVRVVAGHELWRRRRAPLAWGLPLGLMSALVVLLYPSIQGSLDDLAQHYPAGLKEALGVSDLGTLAAYVHAEMFSLLVPVAVAFVGIRAASDALAGAEERGELDVLLSAPVSRRAVAVGAALGAVGLQLGVLLVVGVLTWLPSLAQDPSLSAGAVAAALAGTWSLGIFFTGTGLVAGAALHRSRVATAVAGGVLAAMYLLDVLGAVADPVAPLVHLSAFHYYGAPLREGLDWPGAGLLVGTGALLAAIALPVFHRKDLRSG